MFALVAAVATIPSTVLIQVAWGAISAWLAEVTKQDGFTKWVNTLIADATVVVTAIVTALVQGGGTLTWHVIWSTVVWAGLGALVTHNFFLQPTGIGAALQTATSLVKPVPPVTAPPVAAAPAAPA